MSLLSAQVFKVMAPNNKLFALKKISFHNVDPDVQRGFLEEVKLLKKLHGRPGIIQLISNETYHHDKLMFVLLEFGEIDLNKLLERKQRRWREEGFTDPLKADPQFICSTWREMLKAVNVRSVPCNP